MSIEVSARQRLGAFTLDVAFASEGRLTALFGQSGAGKSAVVNVIAGLNRPQAGRVAVEGEVLLDTEAGLSVPPWRRRIGYVFQEGRLFPHLTVRQNLLYGRWFAPRAERRENLSHVVDLLGIGHLLSRRPPGLSGGEKQRVAIGRALLASPRLLLMDEPLASLDEGRKAEILPFLERLRDETRVPIVYVSHSLAEVTRLADTVVVLNHGRVAASGPLEEIMARLDLRPLTGRQEAGAVLRGRVVGREPTYALTLVDVSGQIMRLPQFEAPQGQSVRLRVLARDVALALEPPRGLSVRNVLAACIAALEEESGAYAEVALDIGGQMLRARVTRQAVDELGLAPGRQVHALIKSAAVSRRLVGVEDG